MTAPPSTCTRFLRTAPLFFPSSPAAPNAFSQSGWQVAGSSGRYRALSSCEWQAQAKCKKKLERNKLSVLNELFQQSTGLLLNTDNVESTAACSAPRTQLGTQHAASPAGSIRSLAPPSAHLQAHDLAGAAGGGAVDGESGGLRSRNLQSQQHVNLLQGSGGGGEMGFGVLGVLGWPLVGHERSRIDGLQGRLQLSGSHAAQSCTPVRPTKPLARAGSLQGGGGGDRGSVRSAPGG
jgi:hypothetical protein